MARKYAGYKRLTIEVTGQSEPYDEEYWVTLISGNSRELMSSVGISKMNKRNANNVARRLCDSLRPACEVRLKLAK